MSKKISKSTSAKLLETISYELRNDLRLPHDRSNVYILGDGRLILEVIYAQYDLCFDPADEYMKIYHSALEPKCTYLLEGFPDTEEAFFSSLEDSKEQLKNELKVDSLDYSLESLKRLDTALRKSKPNFEFYETALYPLLVRYVSKTIQETHNGKWVFKYNPAYNVAEPYIHLPDGRDINLFIDLYEEAMEHFDDFSIYETSLLRIR